MGRRKFFFFFFNFISIDKYFFLSKKKKNSDNYNFTLSYSFLIYYNRKKYFTLRNRTYYLFWRIINSISSTVKLFLLEYTFVSPCTFQVINAERRNASSLEDDGVAVGSRVERIENEEQEEDYEGEDEYEDELKAVAESHEAMSRDDTRNSNVSAAPSTPGIPDRISSPSKNFDSREVIAVNNSSDEDVASNEAITDEIVDKYDQEVRQCSSFFFSLLIALEE